MGREERARYEGSFFEIELALDPPFSGRIKITKDELEFSNVDVLEEKIEELLKVLTEHKMRLLPDTDVHRPFYREEEEVEE